VLVPEEVVDQRRTIVVDAVVLDQRRTTVVDGWVRGGRALDTTVKITTKSPGSMFARLASTGYGQRAGLRIQRFGASLRHPSMSRSSGAIFGVSARPG